MRIVDLTKSLYLACEAVKKAEEELSQSTRLANEASLQLSNPTDRYLKAKALTQETLAKLLSLSPDSPDLSSIMVELAEQKRLETHLLSIVGGLTEKYNRADLRRMSLESDLTVAKEAAAAALAALQEATTTEGLTGCEDSCELFQLS
jgi:hypothetical protein